MRVPRGRLRRRVRERGSALLLVLLITGILSSLAVKLMGNVQEEILLTEAFRDEFRARWAVHAPAAIVQAVLRRDSAKFTGFTSEWAKLPEVIFLDGVQVRFRVYDESAKVNLNGLVSSTAAVREGTARALNGLFPARDIEADLVDTLWDWVDADLEPRTAGGEGGYYAGLPQPYRVKNAPLDSLSELRVIQGFTPKALRAAGFKDFQGIPDLDWSEWLTIYSDGRINVNTVDPLILRNLVEDLPDLFIEDLVERRKQKPVENLVELKLLPGMTDALFNKLAPLAGVDSRYFSVVAEATAGRIHKRLTAVLEKGPGKVGVVYWRIR